MRHFLLLLLCLAPLSSMSQNAVGSWSGTLTTPAGNLKIVFNISLSDTIYSSTMDSPDQGARDIPIKTTIVTDSVVTLRLGNIEYTGTLKRDELRGTFTQGSFKTELNLIRAERPAEPKRPQEPKPPFDYDSKQVTFRNGDIELSGTLTTPRGKGRSMAVVMVTGSGAQDRDEQIMGHKPFLVIADHLTRNGISVLRYDDRGVGGSTGSMASSTTADFAIDVRCAIEFLKTRPEIDTQRIGIIGHSEGGLIAPMVASESDDVAFIVLLAAPAIRGDKLILLQKRLIEQAMGYNPIQVELSNQLMAGAYAVINANAEPIADSLTTYFTSKVPTAQLKGIVAQLSSPWFVNFVRTDPAPYLSRVKCPILALNGGKDLQVPPTENITLIKEITSKAGNSNVTTHIMPKLNHLFQECTTGLPSEYAQIEQTIHPSVLDTMSRWILQQK